MICCIASAVNESCSAVVSKLINFVTGQPFLSTEYFEPLQMRIKPNLSSIVPKVITYSSHSSKDAMEIWVISSPMKFLSFLSVQDHVVTRQQFLKKISPPFKLSKMISIGNLLLTLVMLSAILHIFKTIHVCGSHLHRFLLLLLYVTISMRILSSEIDQRDDRLWAALQNSHPNYPIIKLSPRILWLFEGYYFFSIL